MGCAPRVEDLAVVQRLAAELGVPVHTSALALSPGPGVEARARMARYGALEALRHGRGLDVIATAHTASDQAETLLMRLARGCALAGAAGVLERRADAIVRPLLFATRDEVREYAAATATAWVSDPMNDDRTSRGGCGTT